MKSELYGPMELSKVAETLAASSKGTVIVGPERGFREGTELPKVKQYFVFAGAGMGDFICYMPAILWIARNCPWVDGGVFAPKFFVEFAKNCLREFPDWDAWPAEEIDQRVKGVNCTITGPGVAVNGKQNHQLANGTGGHLVDVGFLYFANMFPPPPGADRYPLLEFDEDFIDGFYDRHDWMNDVSGYVVFTPGAVSDNRTVPGHYWNPIIDWVISKGLTPVFLGKSKMSDNLKVQFPDGCRYDEGLDLRDQTTMLEAAYIMKHARAVLGFDNGLIHLASCTDAKIIAGYGSVMPRDRRPSRPHGRWVELFPSELPCAGCQSQMKRMVPHNFKYCLYKKEVDGKAVQDLKCIDFLFANEGRRWIAALEHLQANVLF